MAVIRDIPSAGFRKNKKVRVSPRGGLRILESGLPVTHESVHHDRRHADAGSQASRADDLAWSTAPISAPVP